MGEHHYQSANGFVTEEAQGGIQDSDGFVNADSAVVGVVASVFGVIQPLTGSVTASLPLRGRALGSLPLLMPADDPWIVWVNEQRARAFGYLPTLRTGTPYPVPAKMTGIANVTVVGNALAFGVLPALTGAATGTVTTTVTGNAFGVISGLRGCLFRGRAMGILSGLKIANPAPEVRARVSSYPVHLADLSRRPSTVITIDLDYCQNQFGTAPCYASGAPCFNTLATCKNIPAYDPQPKTYRFCQNDTPVSVGGITRPYLKSSKVHALEILTSESIVINQKAKLTFFDEPDGDYGIDPYRVTDTERVAPGGTETVSVSGTFWRRLLRRNKYYKGRRVTIWNGFDAGQDDTLDAYLEEFKGVLDGISINADGTVAVTVKGLLQLTDTEIPRKTDGKLFIPITDQADTLQLQPWSGIDSRIAPYETKYTTGLIKVGSEIVSYQSADVDQLTGITSFTGLVRGLYNPYGWDMPQHHEIGVSVHEVHAFAGHPIDIMLALLTLAGLDNAEINTTAFSVVKSEQMANVYFAAVIDKPIKIKKLLAELREQTGTHIWQDESQRITIRYMAPLYPWVDYRQINDEANIIFRSSRVDGQESQRVTRASVHYNHVAGRELKEENFFQVSEYRDVDAEHDWEHGEVKSRKPILSRWIHSIHGGDDYANSLAADVVDLLVDGAAKINFDLELKDSALALGEIFEVTTDQISDDYGQPLKQRYMITKRGRISRGKYRYVATPTGLEGRWLIIAPDDFPDEWVNGTAEQQAYGCISDDSGRAPDGADGYKISRG